MMRDQIVQGHIHRKRDEFIAGIKKDDVLTLARSYHNGDSCYFFKDPARGSYNICFFVEFGPPPEQPESGALGRERWVVRIPLAPCLAFGGRSKLESEVAAMRYIADKTDILIPKIHAYAIKDDSDPISSFIILEYISGEKLSWARLKSLSPADRENLHTSIADIYIQLRRLEFPLIGCLTSGPDGIRVGKKTMSIDINMQELEGLHPSKIQDSFPNKSSANGHMETLLQIAENALMKGRSSITDERGPEYLYHMSIFRQYTQEWIDPSLDKGPFVLVHGDFEPQNLIMTKDCKIAAVVDWEWSRVVPVQLFHPPLWLMEFDTTHLAWKLHFNNAVRKQEMARYGQQMLYQEWEKRGKGGGFPVANALTNWTDIDYVSYQYINEQCYGGWDDLQSRVGAFMEQDPSRRCLVERRYLKGQAYLVELSSLQDEGAERDQGSICSASCRIAPLIQVYAIVTLTTYEKHQFVVISCSSLNSIST
ncbi:phosphotransferase enzyme family protein [Dactylonectria estremocensis]|uniref:Phosphotransferase enzyme family protein n=1 Tax=Dactylonectria estremocensis TaxID=1079267 RepID=A0A9P9IGU0_9HYPO|nr:phosphotransferase enzyme family protein [Dactylonectria estremocensis]